MNTTKMNYSEDTAFSIQQFTHEHNLSKSKQDLLRFALESGWGISVEDNKIHFRKFFPTKGIKHDVSLSPAGTMLFNIFEGKPIRGDLRRGIRSHNEMKKVLNQ